MNEKDYFLDRYSSEFYLLYAKSISEEDWGDKRIASDYLDRYRLTEEEYVKKWKHLQNKIFINQDRGLPEMIFSSDFRFLALRGGVLFLKEDFECLRSCMESMGDKNLIIIQNSFKEKPGCQHFKMKYPVDIDWSELMSGNFISTVLFEMFSNEYFVFSETGNWCKYSANDFENPLDLIAFKPEYELLFKEQFKQSKEEWEEVKSWLPSKYFLSSNMVSPMLT